MIGAIFIFLAGCFVGFFLGVILMALAVMAKDENSDG